MRRGIVEAIVSRCLPAAWVERARDGYKDKMPCQSRSKAPRKNAESPGVARSTLVAGFGETPQTSTPVSGWAISLLPDEKPVIALGPPFSDSPVQTTKLELFRRSRRAGGHWGSAPD